MISTHVLILGAGSCGLVAARELLRNGYTVTVIEARSVAGGRVRTITEHEFPNPIEAGAEFIHGDLPVTLSLLSEYKIPVQPLEGTFWQTRTSKVERKNNFIGEHHRKLVRHLKELNHDLPVEKFLELNFAGDEYEELKNSVRGFVSGYDAADTSRASTFSFREEWLDEDNEPQYRIPDGYGKLMEAITNECTNLGCNFHFLERATRIEWQRGEVAVYTGEGKKFAANKVVVTAPVGLLSDTNKEKIEFIPSLNQKDAVLNQLGYGGVIKLCLLFKNAFWTTEEVRSKVNHDLTKVSFIFSDAEIPTWWTQYPDETPLLTGWKGGKPALELAKKNDDAIIEAAIRSLSGIFRMNPEEIQSQLLAHKLYDWVKDPFALGAYSYEVVEGRKLKEIMREPVEDTIFFAGEGYHEGGNSGTVEAALSEGFRVVRDIIPLNNE